MYQEFKHQSIGRRISLLFRLCMMQIRSEMKKLGFGAGDYAFLAMLFMEQGMSQDEFSRKMRVDKSYTARVLAKLERDGFVERRPDPDEHRIKRVFLGPNAYQYENEFFDILKGVQAILTRDMTERQEDRLRSDLDQMIRNAEDHLGLADSGNGESK